MRLLLTRSAHERIARALPEAVEPVLMNADGSLEIGGSVVDLAGAAPAAAWGSSDLYDGGPVVPFMIACLKSDTLRWFHTSSAGFDHPVFSALADKGLVLTNSDASAPAIAEFVLSRLLDHYQPSDLRRKLQAEKRWEGTPFREIWGTTWMVIGLGTIGCEIARRARAFDAHVIGVRRTPKGDAPVDEERALEAMPTRLGDADVIVLAAPANADSVGLVDAEFLARMKAGSVLINIARGALVDEAALVAALDRGVPELAILDVFATEPLPSDSPLWTHPRVRVSAHDAPNSDGFLLRGAQIFLDNLHRHVRGEPLVRVVDSARIKESVQGNQ